MKKLIVIVAAMVMVATSAYAAEWNFYGSARISTFWTTTDANTVAVADVDQFAEALQGNSRIGASVKVSDELTGAFEYGSGPNLRILWGEWNFGSGSFGVGQNYTPLCMFYSNQVFTDDIDGLAYGGVYSGRAPMLQLKFGSFKIAAVAPNGSNVVGGVSTVENAIPTIEASYALKMDPFSLQVAGGYNTYQINNGVFSYDVDSYVIALGASVKLGIGYINGNIYTGQNAGHLILIETNGPLATYGDGLAGFDAVGNKILDRDSVGYLIVAGAKINDMFSVEFGYGHIASELDAPVGGLKTDDDVTTYYGQAVVTLAPGVQIIPEIGVIDYEEVNQATVNYIGAKWQINF